MQLLHDLEEAQQEASRAAVTARGTPRLTTSVNFGPRHVAPAIAAFLARHPDVKFDVQLSDREGREHLVRVQARLHSNNGELLAEAAARGAGIVFEPEFIVGDPLRAGRLVTLLEDYRAPASPIYAVYPSRKHLSAKVRLFVDFLAERFAGGL